MRSESYWSGFVPSHPRAEEPARGWATQLWWARRSGTVACSTFAANKTGCPTLAAFLFLRLGWDSTAALQQNCFEFERNRFEIARIGARERRCSR
jgi:hypothetical protein